MWEVVNGSDRCDYEVPEASLIPGHRVIEIRQAQVKEEGVSRVL